METISQRELRNRSGEIMRGLERGHSYRVTNGGQPVGILAPITTSPIEERIVRAGTQNMAFDEGAHVSRDTTDLLREDRDRR